MSNSATTAGDRFAGVGARPEPVIACGKRRATVFERYTVETGRAIIGQCENYYRNEFLQYSIRIKLSMQKKTIRHKSTQKPQEKKSDQPSS